jgi:hypothetical protein
MTHSKTEAGKCLCGWTSPKLGQSDLSVSASLGQHIARQSKKDAASADHAAAVAALDARLDEIDAELDRKEAEKKASRAEVGVRMDSWRQESVVKVQLESVFDTTWNVYLDGKLVGEVSRYRGASERPTHKGSRIVIRGKDRDFWSTASPRVPGKFSQDHSYGFNNRADALRSLLRRAGR